MALRCDPASAWPIRATEAAKQLWLADITEHKTGEGELYLCAIKDAYSNRAVGYSTHSRVKFRFAIAASNRVAGTTPHGEFLLPAPEERAEPPLLGHPRSLRIAIVTPE